MEAEMVKLTEPGGALYTILSLSDEEMERANKAFVLRDAPYRVRRPEACISS